jgi:large subunit ribosomal protein L4
MLKKLALGDKKTLFVIPEAKKNFVLSGRNVPNTKIITASQINTYDVLHAEHLILSEGSVEKISNLLNQA